MTFLTRRKAFAALFLLAGLGALLSARVAPHAEAQQGKGAQRFTVPPGFRVEEIVKNPYADANGKNKKPFSIVNMCFDAQGRLLLSEEGGPILLCTNPDKNGVLQDVKPYCDIVKNCHGMCWVDDALLLVGNGPKGTGLYRCTSKQDGDKLDEAALLQPFNGGMGEHGPHAVIHGPDDKLYIVIGNHAHAKLDDKQNTLAANSPLKRWPTGGPGPDQGKAGTTEDVLLPRQNDANGHAANILAPGGTIWRFDKDGKNPALFSAGFRNEFDAAFSPSGELFTFDSDMEWDEALPWYRPVRINHVTAGSEFGWRTGASKIPAYALDTLPAIYDTGRGSPVGVEFYDHHMFPDKYRGCCFMADWSLGILYAVFPKREGAGHTATVEQFCTGKPMNITDCAVAPDGSIYFTLGGRGSGGGVQRISCKQQGAIEILEAQPLSAWGRAETEKRWQGKTRLELAKQQSKLITDGRFPPGAYAKVLALMQAHGLPAEAEFLTEVAKSRNTEVRAQAIYMLGISAAKEGHDTLIKALKDDDKWVQRRACEALIRAGVEPPVEAIWPLLAEKDRFLRTAARLVLQRIDPKQWAERIVAEKNDLVAEEGVIALCKINQAAPRSALIYERLNKAGEFTTPEAALDWLRTVQLALIHTGEKPAAGIVERCGKLFPDKDARVSRELAIVLAHCRKEGFTDKPVHAELLKAMLDAKGDRPQQIHLFYCLRVLHKDWTPAQKQQLLQWFDSTTGWTGGASFTRFLDNILRDLNPIFSAEDRLAVALKADEMPKAAAALIRLAPPDQALAAADLAKVYDRLAQAKPSPYVNELRDAIVRDMAKKPTAENWPMLVRGLNSTNNGLVLELVTALQKAPTKPKLDEPAPFRAVLEASSRIDEKDKNRWKLVELLRHWGVKDFGGETGDSKTELKALARWFGQAFPKEKPLPGTLLGKPPESKYKFDELLAYLEKDPEGMKGDATRGRVVFEKAQCLKCHKYGKEGEGIGPDLSTLSKRFKRFDILESIVDPSKVISDQYRSSTVVLKDDRIITGLVAPQGDTVTILKNNGEKETVKKADIAQIAASLISVMPEKLLDELSKKEIADLFAFLESEPK